ncbi:NAD(P)-binding protein [Agrococcus sp. BE272]|uniref:oxidoreductase n=1 Tax=Agrococcus sp. BE272 TaxID=2817727 RepID=UPI002866573D|nr:NAD(P)-binding protein [Agrococcus sp. BE272]MDR7234958.1 2,4-dienoyl-CoA reductase-like NADH-dependent reductase (Old Yellow Enzyme family) [Agrococcus sp. BE272]
MSLIAQPLRIGAFDVPNRIMQAAHSKQYSDRVESDRETAYFVRRARGGCGLFVAGNHLVHPSASTRGFEDAWRPEAVDANRRMTDAVHEAGARMLVQLNHHGAQAAPEGPDGPRPVYAPSRILSPSTGVATREASARDIAGFVEAWADAAERSRLGGFDGVELHMAHGYLLHQFLSPLYNRRTDAYGGDLEGRTRFPREVLRAVRARVGDDYTVGIRIVLHEHNPEGLDAADLREAVAALRSEARIDFLDTAAGGYHDVHWVFPSSAMPVDWLRDDVAALKAANPDVPVFGVGAARSVEEAEEVLASGVADMVALTRGQLADPDLAARLLTGATDGIRHCIRLNQGCLGRGSQGLPVSCTVNPEAGRELEAAPGRAARPARWTVVGGGPAGMRAALDLARLGHAVTLLEREARPGGQLLRAARVPGRDSVSLLATDLERDARAAGVEVRLGEPASLAAIRATAPDRVALAVGAVPPAGGGAAIDEAFEGARPATVDAWRAMDDPAALGERILVVDDDGTAHASGVLLALVAGGASVEVVTPFERLLPHVGTGYERQLVLRTLAAGRFRRTVGARVRRGEGGWVAVDALTGHEAPLAEPTAIVALTPREAVRLDGLDAELLEAELGVPVSAIGDALSPRGIDAAIAEAWRLAQGSADD